VAILFVFFEQIETIVLYINDYKVRENCVYLFKILTDEPPSHSGDIRVYQLGRNPYIDNKTNTEYYELFNPLTCVTDQNNTVLLSLNIRSLMSNHEELSKMIQNLTKAGANIGAIALQEVWSVPHPDVVNLPGYNLILKTRSNGRGGGIGFYLKSSYKYKVLSDLSPFYENEFECLTIETSINGKKTLLSNFYKPPTAVHNSFVNHLENLLHNLAITNHCSFMFCDSNVNLLKIANNATAREYLDTIHNNGFLQPISKATRIAGNSYSLIDHIICNHYNHVNKTGTILADISDHLINFISINPLTTKTKANSPNKHTRVFSLDKMTEFRNALQQQNWHSIHSMSSQPLLGKDGSDHLRF
jgi:hypothetical protein